MGASQVENFLTEFSTFSKKIPKNWRQYFSENEQIINKYQKQLLDSARNHPDAVIEFINVIRSSKEISSLLLKSTNLFECMLSQACMGNTKTMHALVRNCKPRIVTIENKVELDGDDSYELGFEDLTPKKRTKTVICSETRASDFFSIFQDHADFLLDIILLSNNYAPKVIECFAYAEMARYAIDNKVAIKKILHEIGHGNEYYILFFRDIEWVKRIEELYPCLKEFFSSIPGPKNKLIYLVSQPGIDEVFFKHPAKVITIIKEIGIDTTFLEKLLRNEAIVINFIDYRTYLDALKTGQSQLSSLELDSDVRSKFMTEMTIEDLLQDVKFVKYPKKFIDWKLVRFEIESEMKKKCRFTDILFYKEQLKMLNYVFNISSSALALRKGINVIVIGPDGDDKTVTYFDLSKDDPDYYCLEAGQVYDYLCKIRYMNLGASVDVSITFHVDRLEIVVSISKLNEPKENMAL